MQCTLRPHPASPSLAVEEIVATAERLSATRLRLHYLVLGRIGEIVVPPPASPLRTDDLWQATCFEAFVSPQRGTTYREFNFSPSGAWAAYTFETYREGRSEAALPVPPVIACTRGDGRLEIEVLLCAHLPDEAQRLALTAILQEQGGERTFWAARHPPDEPDFHHPSCFVEQLPPAPPA